MAKTTPYLWIVQNKRLHSVRPSDGKWKVRGHPEWVGSAAITAANKKLFIIQNDRLHAVEPKTGSWTVLGEPDWAGPAFLVASRGVLFAIQNSYFHRVTYGGAWEVLGKPAWKKTVGMSVGSDGIYVVREKEPVYAQGSFWRVDFKTGRALRRMPGSKFGGTTALASIGKLHYIIRDGTLYRLNLHTSVASQHLVRIGFGHAWDEAQAMCAFGKRLYIVKKGRLFAVDPVSERVTILGDQAWDGPAVMTGLSLPVSGPLDPLRGTLVPAARRTLPGIGARIRRGMSRRRRATR